MPRLKLKDIAQAAGLSISTVSMVLGDYPNISRETRTRVRELCLEMNYQPRRRSTRRRVSLGSRARRESRLALLMVGYEGKIDTIISALQFVVSEAEPLNCKLEFNGIPEADDATQIERLSSLARDVDGVLLDGFVRPALLEASARLPVPAVLMGNTYGDPLGEDVGCQVTTDMRGMGQLAARALLRVGHRRIAFVCAGLFENLWFEQWLAGFRHAHADAAVSVDPSLLMVMGSEPNVGARAARAIVAMTDPPDALVIPNPHTASGLLDAMRSASRVPACRNVVIGGARGESSEYQLQDYPFIYIDRNRLARHSLDLILNVPDGETLRPRKCILPFRSMNLP